MPFAPVDPDIATCRALVIDGNSTTRSIQSAQLRDLGVKTVVQCGRIQDARRQLEARPFDIVLCDQEFRDDKYTGQDLLDDLRRAQLMPPETVFVMVTSHATYAAVAEAAESALDGYLIKPYKSSALSERIQHARHRKRTLKDIFDALATGDADTAARHCLKRFRDRAQYGLYAGRLGAELLLGQGRHAEAYTLYQEMAGSHGVPWARLGMARALLESGKRPAAMKLLDELIAEQPDFSDAYDVLGRAQLDQGLFDLALASYRTATRLTPGSIARQQREGQLAFYLGDKDGAQRALERAASTGISSKMFDSQTLALLALLRFDAKDGKGLQRGLDNLQHLRDNAPEEERVERIERFRQVARALDALLQRQIEPADEILRELLLQAREPSFDFESACALAALIARRASAAAPSTAPEGHRWWNDADSEPSDAEAAPRQRLEEIERGLDALALRFCTSRTVAELLACAAVHPPHADRIREKQLKVSALAEEAMTHSLNGEPRASVEALLVHGRETLNVKLIDMAHRVLQGHESKIVDAKALHRIVEELQQRYGSYVNGVPLSSSSRPMARLKPR